MTDRELITKARAAMKNSYSPYSHFPVGAALECENGDVFTGTNVENCAIGCTICAERSAVVAAVSAGHRKFTRIAICSNGPNYCFPCGSCRQVLSEFAPSLEVLCVKNDGHYVSYRLSALLPETFGPDQLN